ncbi:MAG: hypothetical protein ABII01_04525 [Candidatus Woesearchaeota archaeon]
MHKKSGLIFLLTIFVIITLIGCAGRDTDTTDRNWRTGSRGIEMRFQTGSPPYQAYDRDKIDIALELWNRGAEPLIGDIYLTGFDPSIFRGITTRPIPFSILESKTQYNDEGGFDTIRETGTIAVPYGVDTFSTRIDAVACYPYQTIATVAICIDPEPNKNDNNDPCRPGSYGAGTQAAPVAITNVDVESTPTKAIFRINIKNVGVGTIMDIGKIERCLDSDIVPADMNWVDILDARVGNAQYLQCEPSNPVKLPDGSGRINCWLDNPQGNTAYTSTLTLRMVYGYIEEISTNVELRSSI